MKKNNQSEITLKDNPNLKKDEIEFWLKLFNNENNEQYDKK